MPDDVAADRKFDPTGKTGFTGFQGKTGVVRKRAEAVN